ncbi:RNA polymerase, sigma-24 subunit, ECF subfamily [Candidatus Sulfopaludibacter sp. SbA3]|nr:RNA polymerase, sigma-24 subunit, ECF subfamily [Candidatus Sulfopaludibacter sp. SbA3]
MPVEISQMVDRYHSRLVRYLIYLTGRRDQADDLVQETWVRALARADQYDGRSRFEGWLFAIARNLAMDGLRRRQRESPDEPDVALPAPARESPFLAAARGQDAMRVAKALGRLEPIYREALLLRFQEDLSLQEIAGIVGAPVSTVSSRIYRGLELMRSHWKGGANAI